MVIRIPPKRIREKFNLIYELKGCQKAIDFLTEYYRVRRMRIFLNGRKVGNGDVACYFENKAYFTKRGLKRETVLHELYHHLVKMKRLEFSERIEEKEANRYSQEFLVTHKQNYCDTIGSNKNSYFKNTKKSTIRNIRRNRCGRREGNGA